MVIDEAAAIPLPIVKQLMGPYLVFLSSTVNGYEGTGRSLSLKLVHQLRKQAISSNRGSNNRRNDRNRVISASNARKLRELALDEPIRYGLGDGVETWLNDLLCLNCCNGMDERESIVSTKLNSGIASALSMKLSYHPDPKGCELYKVNRDTLFSYNKVSEYFLQKMMSLYVSSHYKNQPNDLQLMSDGPAHQLFVLLGPQNEEKRRKKEMQTDEVISQIPDILAVIQVSSSLLSLLPPIN